MMGSISTDTTPAAREARARAGGREARLRPEHAPQYPGISAGRWECAATLADRVLAARLLHGGTLTFRDRVLVTDHFEFRGGLGPREPGEVGRPRREDR